MGRTVEIVLGAGAEAAEVEEDVLGLRRELLELDVDEVARPAAGEDAPEGARGPEALLAGTLVVTLGQETVKALVAAAVGWLKRRRGGPEAHGGLRIEVDGDVLELRDGVSAGDRALIDAFLARHEQQGAA